MKTSLPKPAFAFATFFAAALALGACGDEGAPPKHGGSPGSSAQAKHEFVQAKLAKAKEALEAKGPRKARDLAEEARRRADNEELKQVLAFIEQIDAFESQDVSKEVLSLAAGQKCAEAMDTIGAVVKKQPPPSPAFLKALHAQTEEKLVACVRADIESALSKGEFAFARSMLEVPSAAIALPAASYKELTTKLRDGIIKQLLEKMQADIKAAKFDAAAAKIKDAVTRGDVGPEEENAALETIRALVLPKQTEQVNAAIGSKNKPEAALAELDALVKMLKWDLGKDLGLTRHALSVWVECSRIHCSALPRPEARWTYGRTALHPTETSGAAAPSSVQSAEKVWVIARAGNLALVATDEDASAIASLKDRLLAADGWADMGNLKGEDTADWLLPGDEIKGQRVFGPLRTAEKDKNYYLGFATAADGDDVSVKRISDDQVVTVPRSSLRSGRLAPGIKVLTACANPLKMEPAKIEREVPQQRGLPLVHIVCVGDGKTPGPAHDEVPGALFTKPEWLPARKP